MDRVAMIEQDEAEMLRIGAEMKANAGTKNGHAKPKSKAKVSGSADAEPPPEPSRLKWRDANKVKPLRVDWLIDRRIPRGMLVTWAGVQGDGKSMLIASTTASITTGRPFGLTPDVPNKPGRVLLFAAEDSFEHTLVPRLAAHDADLNKVRLMDVVDGVDGYERLFSITEDLPQLSAMVKELSDVRLVVFDPVNSFIGAGLNPNKDDDVRPVMERLKRFAAEHGVTVLCVKHLNKSAMDNALHRVSGASAYTEVPRVVWFVTRDKEDNERRKFVCGKMNVAAMPPGASFDIDSNGVVQWVAGELNETASDAIGPDAGDDETTRSRVDEAEQWIRDMLAEQAVRANDVLTEAKKHGIARRTLHRAKANVKVTTTWTSIPKREAWWSLPSLPDSLTHLDGNGGNGGNRGNQDHCQDCHDCHIAKDASDTCEGLPC